MTKYSDTIEAILKRAAERDPEGIRKAASEVREEQRLAQLKTHEADIERAPHVSKAIAKALDNVNPTGALDVFDAALKAEQAKVIKDGAPGIDRKLNKAAEKVLKEVESRSKIRR